MTHPENDRDLTAVERVVAEITQNETQGEAESHSRRSFFSRSALLAAPAALLATGVAKAAGGYSLPNLYPNWNAKNFAEIRADENAHVEFLETALGSAALPAPQFQNLSVPANNPILFAAYASVFENTGSMAYLGALPYIQNQAYVAAAGSIALVEAYHSGYLNTLINFPITPNGVNRLQPFSIAEVVSNIKPYFVNPAVISMYGFTTTPSPQNDIAILNFALLLERLESAYYNANVHTFFGV